MSSPVIKTRKMKVVEHAPWRLPLMIVSSAVVGFGCLFLGYLLGKQDMQGERTASSRLTTELAEVRSELNTLQTEVIDARLRADVQLDAANTLREDMQTQHAEVVQLREAVTFYKNLMSPGELSEGLQVAELEVRPRKAPGLFEFDLLLTQIARRRSYIGGEVSLDLVGSMSDPEISNQVDEGLLEVDSLTRNPASPQSDDVVLSLTELNEDATYPLKFRFRYFQNLTGNLLLPDGFHPRHVLITAHQKGKDALQVSFPWPRS